MYFEITDELNEKFMESSADYKEWFDNKMKRDGVVYVTEAYDKVLELFFGIKPTPKPEIEFINYNGRKYELLDFENDETQR